MVDSIIQLLRPIFANSNGEGWAINSTNRGGPVSKIDQTERNYD